MPISERGGGALLAVMWLSAALSVIALSIAATVHGETERTSTAMDSLKAYYLAVGAVERGILHVAWGPTAMLPNGLSRYYSPATPVLHMSFPTGEAQVEVIPEASKLNLNSARPEDLFRLLLNLGAPPEQANEVARAIMDWRSQVPTAASPFDQFYLSRAPSFRAPHASFEEIEELLLVKGMTPELYYGTWERDAQGQLTPRGGLRDCVSIYGATEGWDVNTAHPAVLATIGVPPDLVAAIVARRAAMPYRNQNELMSMGAGAPGLSRLRLGGHSIFTLRATARVRLPNGGLSDTRRTVAAMVKYMPAGYTLPYHVLRWYDHAWSN